MKDLGYITFKQLIYTVNIRQYYNEKQDAFPIRLFLEQNDWIDLAWYDWFNKDACWKNLEKFLSKDILNSYVTGIGFLEDNNQICIWLVSKPTQTLQELAN